jgi:hypothetical protein
MNAPQQDDNDFILGDDGELLDRTSDADNLPLHEKYRRLRERQNWMRDSGFSFFCVSRSAAAHSLWNVSSGSLLNLIRQVWASLVRCQYL